MHMFTENNQAADLLANFGCDNCSVVIFLGVNQIPRKLCGILRLSRLKVLI